ncbi:hypothetical protein TTHERM_001473448 (macronuclear) [Tetrahymena thermophila SB210]|uniref:Uncharacterized protein n=1 Tax=Tetrahymena thermophila (strain SB210) TaxID=312017 RepID=W7X2Y5_TETTS|nr:hypothetical protein TTHERM_001473448 [Tetrahymena thermophila SB210]EWS73685.1 hypothetical protein TTHERM_001473448 [Tetrahymena thermophila SB210]|eukprot:XP_012653815.1 hypothetical protein TTHERM_001473448 [Tetrahymena thermophila SB210]
MVIKYAQKVTQGLYVNNVIFMEVIGELVILKLDLINVRNLKNWVLYCGKQSQQQYGLYFQFDLPQKETQRNKQQMLFKQL